MIKSNFKSFDTKDDKTNFDKYCLHINTYFYLICFLLYLGSDFIFEYKYFSFNFAKENEILLRALMFNHQFTINDIL